MRSPRFIRLFAALFLLAPLAGRADLFDQLGLSTKKPGTNAAGALLGAGLSQDQMTQGLKDALGQGVQRAIGQLGHDGGFLTNLNVKIPMPEKMRPVEKSLRSLGQEKLADEFIQTMNRAAEQAVPAAASVFGDAIRQMSMGDARAILNGTNNAATDYFRRATQTNLFEKFHPIVQKATAQAGVTGAYKRVMEKASLGNSFGGLGRGLLNSEAVDIDSYVTHRAMDGLFKMVADEEKRIRENPVARTTDLLKKVFGGTKL